MKSLIISLASVALSTFSMITPATANEEYEARHCFNEFTDTVGHIEYEQCVPEPLSARASILPESQTYRELMVYGVLQVEENNATGARATFDRAYKEAVTDQGRKLAAEGVAAAHVTMQARQDEMKGVDVNSYAVWVQLTGERSQYD